MMTLLWPILAITCLLARPGGVSADGSSASPPSPMKRMIIVHGLPAGNDPAIIDADTAALLDEAIQTANGDNSAFILLKAALDSAGVEDADATLTSCQAEAMRAYLANHGIDPNRVRVDMEDGLHPLLVSRANCENGATLRQPAN